MRESVLRVTVGFLECEMDVRRIASSLSATSSYMKYVRNIGQKICRVLYLCHRRLYPREPRRALPI